MFAGAFEAGGEAQKFRILFQSFGNASQAGLFVATYQPMQPGERRLLRFELLGERIEIEGEVQWRRGASEHASPGVGVAFLDVSPNARELIDTFCTRREPLYYEVDAT